jgi:hypothetical protein
MLVPCFVTGAQPLYLVREHPLGEEDRSRETAEKTLLREPGQLSAALPLRRQFQSVVQCGNIRYEEDPIARTLVWMKEFAGLLSQIVRFTQTIYLRLCPILDSHQIGHRL